MVLKYGFFEGLVLVPAQALSAVLYLYPSNTHERVCVYTPFSYCTSLPASPSSPLSPAHKSRALGTQKP